MDFYDHLPGHGGTWVCGCPAETHPTVGQADRCRARKLGLVRYVVEPLALGWFCVACGVFNGDAKEFLTRCRSCGAGRPEVRGG